MDNKKGWIQKDHTLALYYVLITYFRLFRYQERTQSPLASPLKKVKSEKLVPSSETVLTPEEKAELEYAMIEQNLETCGLSMKRGFKNTVCGYCCTILWNFVFKSTFLALYIIDTLVIGHDWSIDKIYFMYAKVFSKDIVSTLQIWLWYYCGNFGFHAAPAKRLMTHQAPTLESVIDIGQGISVGPGRFGKKEFS